MRRTRSLTGFLMLVVALALSSIGLVAGPATAAREKLIQGVVVDQGGYPVLDVQVSAIDADGNIVATDLSYENTDGDGEAQPGYFALRVGVRGTFTVTFAKAGHTSQTVEGVEIFRGSPVASLGEVEVPKRLVATTTTAALVKSTVTTDERGRVELTVKPGSAKPLGEVVVQDGRKVLGSTSLRSRDKGVASVILRKLDRGTYDLKVIYEGSAFHRSSTSSKLTLTVKAPRRHRLVPNALPFVG